MPELQLPIPLREVHDTEHLFDCGLYRTLPKDAQDFCQRNVHALRYLHALPTEDIGVPQFVSKPTRKLGDLPYRNLLYPVSDEILIHIWSAKDKGRDLYIPVEPTFKVPLNGHMAMIEERLLDRAHQFATAQSKDERRQGLTDAMSEICDVSETPEKGSRGRGLFSFHKRAATQRVALTPGEFESAKYQVIRDKAGLGVLEPMVLDPHIEDISCSGLGPVFLEHKIFKSVQTAFAFTSHDELDEFVLRLSEQIKRPVTMRNPIVDAVLPDGSRINIVYGREVSQRGSNFTIRKFSDTPLSVLELIEFGSLDYTLAAYLSVLLEEGMNVFVSGETASGKTTLMNAILTFVPPDAKIVSIEDTPEVQVPHPNWVREVAKAQRAGEKGAAVTMMDLLKAALRQRPNLLIIGEIRAEEAVVAFQAMQTGHAVMATFHASTVEKLIQRLTGSPISIPKTYVDNLNAVVIQSAVKLPNGKIGRRAISVAEIVGYDPTSNSFSFVEVFRWDAAKDIFEFVGDNNSYLLEQKIAPRRGLPPQRKREIYNHIKKRANILQKLHKEKKITGYYELYRVLAQAQRDRLF